MKKTAIFMPLIAVLLFNQLERNIVTVEDVKVANPDATEDVFLSYSHQYFGGDLTLQEKDEGISKTWQTVNRFVLKS